MEIEEIEDFGYYIQSTRKKYGLTQEGLSIISGITRSTISNLETGKAKDTHLSTIIKLSHTLKLGMFMQEVQKD